MDINVYSEIGKLKKVLVHRPGKEVERIYPEIFSRLLFDDIMYLEVAQEEHDYFTNKLREEDVEVFYIEKLVANVIDKNPKLKEKFIEEYLELANISNKSIFEASKNFFLSYDDNLEMVEATIAGLKKTEINPKFEGSLKDMIIEENEYPFYIDPIPNILFARDPIASIFDGMNFHNMQSVTRKREKIYFDYIFKYHSEFKKVPLHITPNDTGNIEGGDILIINKETIFIGISERTTPEAVEDLSERLLKKYDFLKRVVGIEIPKSHATMHLDTILTQMDHHLFSVDANMAKEKYSFFEITRGSNDDLKITKIVDNIKKLLKLYIHPDVKIVIVGGDEIVRSKREQWNDGANCLCIEPGKVIVYNRNKITNELIRKMGIKTIEIKSSELSSGRGGPRCMSMPLERDEV